MENSKNKSIYAWAFYDWANSAYVTIVISGFFPIFFKEYFSSDVDVTVSTAQLGFANSISTERVIFYVDNYLQRYTSYQELKDIYLRFRTWWDNTPSDERISKVGRSAEFRNECIESGGTIDHKWKFDYCLKVEHNVVIIWLNIKI